MEQQHNINNKIENQRKIMPIELLFDIFKSTNISLIDLQMCLNKMDKTSTLKNQLKRYWYNYINNLLTSSGLVKIFMGDDYKKTILQIMVDEQRERKRLKEEFSKIHEREERAHFEEEWDLLENIMNEMLRDKSMQNMIDEINQYVKSIVVHKDVGEAKIFLQERANEKGKDRYLNTSSTSGQNGTDTASRSARRSKRVYGFICDFESCSERFSSIAKLSIHKKVKHGMLNRDGN